MPQMCGEILASGYPCLRIPGHGGPHVDGKQAGAIIQATTTPHMLQSAETAFDDAMRAMHRRHIASVIIGWIYILFAFGLGLALGIWVL